MVGLRILKVIRAKLLFTYPVNTQAEATLEALGRPSESADTAVHGVIGSSKNGFLELIAPLITDRLGIPAVCQQCAVCHHCVVGLLDSD